MKVEVSLGEVVDKITILKIKAERLSSEVAVADVQQELASLLQAWTAEGHPPMEQLDAYTELDEVNRALWDVEDALRDHEARGEFGPAFVDLARSVYRYNDRRSQLKREINHALGSRLQEHKSYGDAPGGPL